MIAAGNGHHECVDLLLKAGADKDIQNRKGGTALMMASFRGHHLCVDLLLKAGANKDIQHNGVLLLFKAGRTALLLATGEGHQACIQLLQQADVASADDAMGSLLDDLEAEKAKKNKKKKHKNASSSLADQGHCWGLEAVATLTCTNNTHTHMRAYAHTHTHMYYTHKQSLCAADSLNASRSPSLSPTRMMPGTSGAARP